MLGEIKKVASDSTMTAVMMTTFIKGAKRDQIKYRKFLKEDSGEL